MSRKVYTNQQVESDARAVSAEAKQSTVGTIGAGWYWVTLLLFPIAGFIASIVFLAKPEYPNGSAVALLLCSFVGWFVATTLWVLLLSVV